MAITPQLIRRIANTARGKRAVRWLFGLLVRAVPELPQDWRRDFVCPLQDVPREVASALDAIPSQTSRAERRFLYWYFSMMWSGRGDVIEIGPYLGGTTRAIAMGMCANPRADANSRLRTYDRFRNYGDLQWFKNYLQPLVRSGALSNADIEAIGPDGGFLDIFKKIHEGHEYYQRVVPTDLGVPDRAEDSSGGPFLKLAGGPPVEAVFVDGCKSWYGTKYFMREVANVAVPGAVVMFQDYGWHTCFWLPAFVHLLGDHFRLLGHVKSTYAFSLVRALDSAEIDRVFPDEPAELGEKRFENLFDRIIADSVKRNDAYGTFAHTAQKAGALGYLGNTDKARQILAALGRSPWVGGRETEYQLARERPTYSPDGWVRLTEEPDKGLSLWRRLARRVYHRLRAGKGKSSR